ncbi:MAG: sn-glycerol-1-phosphate dehydrogenase [Candidatus Merdivicinus sp.]|jgi:glycerol-1-phosphate dehydrogenase [NAD(P)+]
MFEMKCSCSQGQHTAPVKRLEVSEGAIEKTAEILAEYHRIFLVADETTYRIAGKRVEAILQQAGILSHTCILPDPALPDDTNVGRVLIAAGTDAETYDINAMSCLPDYILAVGSGSINDICRMVSYRLGLEYGVVGTAPSMDGYASVVSPLLTQQKKIVYTCTIARHIILDLNICAEAPYLMLQAGVGDMLGKYIALLDWEIAREHIGEYYCPQIAEMVRKAADQCSASAGALAERSMDAIRSTAEGLILSGLCIAYTGTSRPASGTEHMIGQTWEVMDIEEGKVPNLHGIEVGEGTFAAIAIFRKLYQETEDSQLKELIGKYLPCFDQLETLQRQIHLPFTVKNRERFIEGILRGRTFRDRYTILEYLYRRGELERYAEAAYTEAMKLCPNA